ncbi:MAG: hypothetical protein M3068_04755 [Gemmatimonadota bacterium]|nr:hypothetical protein [Gemmatimonadota bacterium]
MTLIVTTPFRRERVAASSVVIGCVAVHILSSALALGFLGRMMEELIARSPSASHVLLLRDGLYRLLVAGLFLPSAAVVGCGVVVWLLRPRDGDPDRVLLWALGFVPLALQSVGRAITIAVSEPPATLGGLMELPDRFDFGLRAPLELAGMSVSPAVSYWLAALGLGPLVAIWCWSRAAARPSRRGIETIDRLIAALLVTTCYLTLALVAQLAAPVIVQLFLGIAG